MLVFNCLNAGFIIPFTTYPPLRPQYPGGIHMQVKTTNIQVLTS